MEVDPAPVITTLDDSDDDDELPDISASFVRASQYRIPKAKVDQDLGQNLAPLKEWLHVNCQTIDERKADNVQDDVLRDMVLRSIESLRISNVKASADGDDSSDDEDIRPVGTVRKHEYAGGEVTFVLHVSQGLYTYFAALLTVSCRSRKRQALSTRVRRAALSRRMSRSDNA